jgi:ABC-type transport system involved in multi-copper enzyme maturation permease subunit
MNALDRFLTIVHLTLHEAARRRILFAALLGALAFLVLFAIGFHFVARDVARHGPISAVQKRLILNFFTLAGLFATNFLSVLSAVLLPIDTLSGEISSGVMQTLASKPVRRSEILLGKWFAYWLVCAGYLLLVAGGVLAVARFAGHFLPPNPVQGVALMLLETTCFVTLSIAGGTRLSTVTNGVLAFALFGLAFIGSSIEQIAAMTNNLAARNVGAVTSLLVPTDAMWQLAAHVMQPPLLSELHATPFSTASVPSVAMVWWAAGWALGVLLLALRGFARRPL